MELSVWEKFIDTVIDTDFTDIDFSWQGGEPTLLGVAHMRILLEICHSRLERNGIRPWHSIHTNGTLINNDWISLFLEYGFAIGISLDGYSEITDKHRGNPERGVCASDAALNAISLTSLAGLHTSITSTFASPCNVDSNRLYSFYKTLHVDRINIEPCLTATSSLQQAETERSLNDFVDLVFIKLFKKWLLDNDTSRPMIAYFSELVGIMNGAQSTSCHMSGTCVNHITLQPDGVIYPCDHFVGRTEYALGNVSNPNTASLLSKLEAITQSEIFRTVRSICKTCSWFTICKGGCPYQRLTQEIPRESTCERIQQCWRKRLLDHVATILGVE